MVKVSFKCTASMLYKLCYYGSIVDRDAKLNKIIKYPCRYLFCSNIYSTIFL